MLFNARAAEESCKVRACAMSESCELHARHDNQGSQADGHGVDVYILGQFTYHHNSEINRWPIERSGHTLVDLRDGSIQWFRVDSISL